MLPLKIFKAYDIRGRYQTEITNDGFKSLGISIKKWMNELGLKNICLGYDSRFASKELCENLMVGLGVECNVFLLPKTTTPAVLFYMMHLKLDVGLIVTASHNPWEDNGLKIYIRQENVFSKNNKTKQVCLPVCGQQLKELFYLQENCDGNSKITSKNLQLDQYIKWIVEKTNTTELSVIWNANFGGSSAVLEKLLKYLKGEHKLISKSCDEQEKLLPVGSDPMHQSNVEQALQLKADVVFSFDGDGDRLHVIYKGRVFTSEYIAVILALKYKMKKIVHDVHMSQKYINFLNENGIKTVKSRVGHSFVQEAMRTHNADLGVEASGHFFWKECFGADDALLTAVKVLNILDDDFPAITAYKTAVKRIEVENSLLSIQKLREQAKQNNWQISTIDGVKIFLTKGWILIRSSNTQPMLSIMIESYEEKDLGYLEKWCDNVLKKIII